MIFAVNVSKEINVSIIGRSEAFCGEGIGKNIESVGHHAGLIKVLEEVSEATNVGVL